MFERYTERARQVVRQAQEEARGLNHGYIGTEHVLLGLLAEGEGLAARVLAALDITSEKTRAQVVRVVGYGDETPQGQIPFTARAKKVLELGFREALSLGHNYVGTEHLLLGLVRENEGAGACILLDFDADSEKIRNEVIRSLSGPPRTSEAERWAEYIICRQRGHSPSNVVQSDGRDRCEHCGTTYWSETVEREQGAPREPADLSGAEREQAA